MSIESVMPFNHLILCHPLILPSIFPNIRVSSNESAVRIRWSKYWSFSFSISPSKEYSGLISFKIDWFEFLSFHGILKSLLQQYSSKASIPLEEGMEKPFQYTSYENLMNCIKRQSLYLTPNSCFLSARFFTYVNSFNPHNHPAWYILLLYPFYKRKNRRTERLSSSRYVTRSRFKTWQCDSRALALNCSQQ